MSLKNDAFPSSEAFDVINSALQSSDAERKDAIKQGNAIFAFTLKNKAGETESWHIDLKNEGKVGKGLGEKPTVTLSLSDDDFGKLIAGKANAQRLFMGGKLKVKGDVMKATKMEPILKKAQAVKAKLRVETKTDTMADVPQRANAAQLAARNIKAKPTMRRKTPLRSDNLSASTPSFAPNPSQGGGLFGGSIQAPTTFNFTSSFQAPSFGGNNPFTTNNSSDNEDSRADTTGEEAARRNKSFRVEGNATEPQNQNMPFQFPASSQPATSGSLFGSTNAPASNLFSFGQNSQSPITTGVTFNSPSSQNQQKGNMFSLGPNQSQLSQSGNNMAFGSVSTENKPASNSFGGFGQSVSTENKPASSSFGGFGQSTTQPPVSQPLSSSSFTFGSTTPQSKPTNNVFSFDTGVQTPKPTGGLFGSSTPPANPFAASQSQTPAPSTNIFGSFNQQPKSTSTSQDPTPTNMFGSQQQDSATNSANIFSGQSQQLSQTNGLFGSKEPASSTSNIFGGLKSVSSSANNMFGNVNDTQTTSNPFGQTTQPEPTVSMDISPKHQAQTSASNMFGNLNQSSTPSSNIFGNLNKSVNHQSEQAKPSVSDGSAATANGAQQSGTGSFKFGQNTSGSPFGFKTQADTPSNQKMSQAADAAIAPKPSFGIMQHPVSSMNGSTLFSPLKPVETPKATNEPPSTGIFTSSSQQKSESTPTTISTKQSTSGFSFMPSTPVFTAANGAMSSVEPKGSIATTYSEMAAASDVSDDEIARLVPADFSDAQKREFYAGYRLRCLNKAMQKFFGQIPFGADITTILTFYAERRENILNRSGVPFKASKRKNFEDEDQENENPNKRVKPAAIENSVETQPATKQRAPSPQKQANRGKGSQAQARSVSPVKSQPQVNGTTVSSTPLFPAPQLQQPVTTFAASPSPKGKRKAEIQLTNQDPTGEIEEERRAKMSKLNGSSNSSETMKRFKNIVDTPGNSNGSSPDKPVFSLSKSGKDDQPRPNPFAALSVPATPAAIQKPASSTPSSTTVNPPTQNTPNLFAPKSTGSQTIKPPTFGAGPVNFLAQFKAKASQDTEDTEKKLMERAKTEDMDSDEDEAEWESKYKEKRKAELKEIEELAKGKQASFIAGKGFNFGQDSKIPASSTTKNGADERPAIIEPSPSKPLFGQSSGQQSTGNSIFSSNGSRTSTPGPATSRPGSVLDLHTPGKPVSFGANIFGHLSDADSGAESGKGNDADEESGSSDTDRDSEKKDPTYQPDQTADEETTGPGITSAKKAATPNPFSPSAKSGFGGSTAHSGTSTPGGSLFDRISKDSNGNPIRQVSTEEKENAKPTTNLFGGQSNIFGSLNKTPSTPPTDKTWKTDSPIKFGSSQQSPFKFGDSTSSNGAPAVSVTAATPTKPATSLGGLFGSSSTSKPLSTSNPFGTVGFGFGAASSTTSSLLPSAAVSGDTSRATTPGGTTDGESTNDANDPDGERHEQIDLTKGGAGEENEDVLHEVRAKALKYTPKEEGEGSPWETKGLGPLRVLKHKETNSSRILLRADPSGKIVLNKSILGNVEYKAAGKTLKLLTAGESGGALETWILQLKTPELAEDLAKYLEANKPSS
ncbi:hypothetical protein B7463_g7204, partial [Scytalidium lignicola]